MAALLSKELPAPAADLTLRQLDLLLSLADVERRKKPISYSYWQSWLGFTYAQARTVLAKIEAAGFATSRIAPDNRKFWTLTETGRTVITLLTTRSNEPVVTDRKSEQSSCSAPKDLYEAMSQKGRDALRSALQDPIHGRIVDQLRTGNVPDPDQLMAWGIRELVARDIANSAARVAERVSTGALQAKASPVMDDTRVSPATDADVQRAREAGVPIPVIEAGEGDNADAVAQAAQLLVREAAVRRPALLQRGILLGRLPQLIWAMLHGAVADYGSLLKRARALLRWLHDGRFEIPKGYDPEVGASIRARLRITGSEAPLSELHSC